MYNHFQLDNNIFSKSKFDIKDYKNHSKPLIDDFKELGIKYLESVLND